MVIFFYFGEGALLEGEAILEGIRYISVSRTVKSSVAGMANGSTERLGLVCVGIVLIR